MQEPHITLHTGDTGDTVTDPNWRVIELLTDQHFQPTDKPPVKRVLYIDNALHSHTFSAVSTNLLNVSGVKLQLPHPDPPPPHLLSAYLPPGQAWMMNLLDPILTKIGPKLLTVGMGQTWTIPHST